MRSAPLEFGIRSHYQTKTAEQNTGLTLMSQLDQRQRGLLNEQHSLGYRSLILRCVENVQTGRGASP
jgi:hypothetical protein